MALMLANSSFFNRFEFGFGLCTLGLSRLTRPSPRCYWIRHRHIWRGWFADERRGVRRSPFLERIVFSGHGLTLGISRSCSLLGSTRKVTLDIDPDIVSALWQQPAMRSS